MTRELKLALIVGFALVLVVTVLISDHLSHARQTKLATLPSEPSKVTEPLPIALENGVNNLPQTNINEPVANAPAPLIGSMPGTDPEPVLIAQGSARPASTTPGTIDLINPNPQVTTPAPIGGTGNPGAVQPIASGQPTGGTIEDAVRNMGGRIEGNNIFVPGLQTSPVANTQPQNTGLSQPRTMTDPRLTKGTSVTPTSPLMPVTPVVVTPAVTDRLHTVGSGDNLFKISTKYYNDGKAWRKLAKYNGIDAETPLKIGQKLKVPTNDVLLGKPATPAMIANTGTSRVTPVPGTTSRPGVVEPKPVTVLPVAGATPAKTRPYTIKKGDSLAAIAQRELGTTKKAKDILELNKKLIKNPDSVPLGVTILLPAA